jgi:hypothetical protein
MKARYRLLSAEEQAVLSPLALQIYLAERATFAAEVEQQRRHLGEHGWLDVTPGTSEPGGRGPRYYLRCGRLYGPRAGLRRRCHQGKHSPQWEGPPAAP